jgi:photosynthetic reaction center H subunit
MGAITDYMDVGQLTLYVFWIFFAALIFYLRREDKREGYPLVSTRSRNISIVGWPPLPKPKTFKLHDGTLVSVPRAPAPRVAPAATAPVFPGAPIQPTGNPMIDAVGPASYVEREEVPDMTLDGHPKIVPMRVATEFNVEERDPDPRGVPVIGADGKQGGVIKDIWVDRSEPQIRYLEVEVPVAAGTRRVLLPINFARISAEAVKVQSILGRQFADVPGLRNPDQITLREEDKVCAYYAGGHLYAEPSRLGPWL